MFEYDVQMIIIVKETSAVVTLTCGRGSSLSSYRYKPCIFWPRCFVFGSMALL